MTQVAVVGLGKIGLPLAALYASKGMDVAGCDIDESVVDAVNAGVSPIAGEPGLDDAIAKGHKAGRLRATTDTAAAVAESDVIVMVVRVALDESRAPDFSQLDAAAEAVGRGLRPGALVILETTMPVGATRNHLGAHLRDASGLEEGAFHLVYSPERVQSGRLYHDLETYPKLIGGVDEESGQKAADFYRRVLNAEVRILPDAETAEFTKLAESVYRDVNIALANELAKAADALGVDFATAAQAANSQPFSHLHVPGVGVGGHCIPVYPYFLLETVDQPIIRLARETNDGMAAYALDRLAEALPGGLAGKTVLVLGLAYRGGVREVMLSSALELVAELRARGARAIVHDPLFSDAEIAAYGVEPSPLPPEAPIDAVILQAAHPEYRDLNPATLKGCRVFLDGRGGFDRGRVEAAGMRYIRIGGGSREA
ncbi:MAG TPA: nucleotide sugar dehydrogenase [Dehalococcoidia bacterium]|nr:nucleotide sugar dehydrogenase [Dehalococcoidia bacterium]